MQCYTQRLSKPTFKFNKVPFPDDEIYDQCGIIQIEPDCCYRHKYSYFIWKLLVGRICESERNMLSQAMTKVQQFGAYCKDHQHVFQWYYLFRCCVFPCSFCCKELGCLFKLAMDYVCVRSLRTAISSGTYCLGWRDQHILPVPVLT